MRIRMRLVAAQVLLLLLVAVAVAVADGEATTSTTSADAATTSTTPSPSATTTTTTADAATTTTTAAANAAATTTAASAATTTAATTPAPTATAPVTSEGAKLAPSDTIFFIIITVTMPYTMADFNTDVQLKYKAAVASAAGTISDNVDIVSTKARRRAGSVKVETKIRARNKEGITTASKSLGTGKVLQDKLDANLKTQGLQASTGVSDPFVNDPVISNVSRIRAGVTTSAFTIVVTLFALHN